MRQPPILSQYASVDSQSRPASLWSNPNLFVYFDGIFGSSMDRLKKLVPRRTGRASRLGSSTIEHPRTTTAVTPLTTALSTTTPSIITTSTAPPSSVAAVPLSSPQNPILPPWSAEALWKDAYEKLEQKEPELAQSFEQASGASLNSTEQIRCAIRALLDKREERQWIIAVAGRSINVRENGERLIKFILWSKDIVADGLSSQPHMALAWSGITMLLPVCGKGPSIDVANAFSCL
jgi:hypothetical protein